MTCPHGFESPASCVDCMQDGPVAPPRVNAPWRKATGSFRAEYEGQCEGCPRDISRGQWIVRWERGDIVVYCHENCRP